MKELASCFICILLTTTVMADPLKTDGAIPANLHIYNEAGNTYVDHLAGYCSSRRFILNPNHLKYDELFSLLLAAQMAKKEVRLRFDGCNSIGQGKIVGVYLAD